ncbi:hypothetical protein F1737_09040 [Methanoplanus sp. FWC-SCC4]|uniref:Uncharacterized protein n=1 Tax=Methanochimaera problematica TaxID=2609417 RepID=A0AA97FD93_9EURY|nr:hypothetical protein [Methanoplanus sp. FWC-SCC4]WOF16824.1 hypothetical protein F1737_09040 [Methanoplanus sp. FWC-SCC4]
MYPNTPNQPTQPLLPPEILRFQKMDLMLGEGTDYEPLAHLSQEQIKTIELYKAFHQHLIQGGVEDGIDIIITFLEGYKHLSPSVDRLGRMEIAGMLKSAPSYQLFPEKEKEDDITKKSLLDRLFGGKK